MVGRSFNDEGASAKLCRSFVHITRASGTSKCMLYSVIPQHTLIEESGASLYYSTDECGPERTTTATSKASEDCDMLKKAGIVDSSDPWATGASNSYRHHATEMTTCSEVISGPDAEECGLNATKGHQYGWGGYWCNRYGMGGSRCCAKSCGLCEPPSRHSKRGGMGIGGILAILTVLFMAIGIAATTVYARREAQKRQVGYSNLDGPNSEEQLYAGSDGETRGPQLLPTSANTKAQQAEDGSSEFAL